MQGIERKSAMLHVLSGGLLLLGICWLLGYFVALQEYKIINMIVLAVVLVVLFFLEARYLILLTATCLLLASSRVLPFSEWCITLRWIFLGTLAFRATTDWISGNVPTRLRGVDFWAAVVIALAFFSQVYSILPRLTFERSASIALLYLAVFWGVWNYVRDEDKIEVVINDFLKMAFIIFFLSVTVFFEMDQKRERLIGIFSSANVFGLYAILIAPLALWNLFCNRKNGTLVLLFLILASLLLSRSRAGMLGTGLGAGYFLWFYHFRQRRAFFTWFLFFVIAVVLYHELFGLSSAIQFLRMDWKTLYLGGGRMEGWIAVMKLILLRPWLGYGFGTEDHLFKEFDIYFNSNTGGHAHNSYLGLVSQLGLVGAFLFFIPVFFFFFRRNHQIASMLPDDRQYGLQLALNAVILGVLVHAFFESTLYSAGNPLMFYFWAIVAIAYRLERSGSKDLSPAPVVVQRFKS